MARIAFIAVAMGMIGASNALTVTSPAAGLSIIADRTYTVEWTGGSGSRYEIDLYYCGSYCTEDSCGEELTALCPYGLDGCPDSKGDYDILMSEPKMGTSGSGYKVRVADVESGEADCSGDFYLVASTDAPEPKPDSYYMIVTSPEEGDVAMAGEEYTIEFDYMNGAGSTVDRFAIDLYMTSSGRRLQGADDCGTWVTSLCDKPAIGCKDSMGDYDIEIPEDLPSGIYSIRVGRFEDDALFDCSAPFEIINEDEDSMTLSYTL